MDPLRLSPLLAAGSATSSARTPSAVDKAPLRIIAAALYAGNIVATNRDAVNRAEHTVATSLLTAFPSRC